MAMMVENRFTRVNWGVMLNRNSNWLSKSLTRLSSGQRINSAADNASDFSISERMSAELRGLNQTDQNVQNGSSMLKVAEGGIQKVIDVLQDMKSLAVNAANDSNTSAERNVLQKEMTQRLATINDIANGTKYNGTGLIDGTYDTESVFLEDSIVVKKFNLQSLNLSPNENYTKEVYINGTRVVIGENKVENLTRSFTATNSSITSITNLADLKSNTKPKMDCDIGFSGNYPYPRSEWNWATNYSENLATGDYLVGGSTKTMMEIGVEINFGSATGYSGSIPDAFHDQGFSILCNGCSQYINIVFDKTMNIGQGTLTTYTTDTLKKDFRVGIGDATSINDLGRAIFEGIQNSGRDPNKDSRYDTRIQSTGEVVAVTIDKSRHNFRIAKNPNYNNGSSAEYIFLKDYGNSMLFIDSGTILAMGNEDSHDNLPQGTVTQTVSTTQPEIQKINVDAYTNAEVWDEEKEALETIVTHGSPLGVHDGTKFKEYDRYTIKSMQTKDLMIGNVRDDEGEFLNNRDRLRYEALSGHSDRQRELIGILEEEATEKGDVISLTTVEGANNAIKIIDRALEYAIENATRLGAYLNRMENDQERIFVMETNTTLSQSAIRDVDVSKEMVAYTRAQVLSKASQLMFAQAGQNSFSVLNLVS